MDLDWLKDFLSLAEHKTFSRAADTRNVTQPAFSRRIRALEDWIGTPLFVRGAQGATLTPAGLYLQPLAVDLMRALERARRDTRAIGDRETMALSIAATHALSYTFFPSWIRRLTPFKSLGTLNLISDTMQACEQILLAGEVHFLLCHFHSQTQPRFDPDRFPGLIVGTDMLIPLCAPDADGHARWMLPGTSTEPVPYLAYSQASGLGRIVEACRGDVRTFTVTALTSRLAATLMTMAREGHGVAWLPRTLAAEERAQDHLVRAGPEQFDIPIEIRLFRSLDCRSQMADELWDHLAASPPAGVESGSSQARNAIRRR